MSKSDTRVKIRAKIRPRPPASATSATSAQVSDMLDIDDILAFPIYDLRDSGGVHDSLDANTGIVNMLDELINHTIKIKASASGKEKSTHQRRINSFIRGRDAIKDYDQEIKSGSQAQKLEGVGKGIATRIDEFLRTGKLAELDEAIDPEAKLIMSLTGITGIGEVKAKSLIKDHGVKSVDDLIAKYRSGELQIAKNQLTHHIAVGLEYYYDLQQRMPWSEANQIATNITHTIKALDSALVVNVCGSYRRKKKTCGDLDVLISHPDDLESSPLPEIVTELEKAKILCGHLTTKGKTKYMGVCKGPSGVGRRVDIRFVEYSCLGAALLYFTGSGKFNKIMRHYANIRGYTLNEYGLFTYVNSVKGDKPIYAPTEQDIFKQLKFVYLNPTEREF